MQNEERTLLNLSRRLLLEHDKTQTQIAQMLYVSETTLRGMYLKHFAMPPKRYIRMVKLKKAQTLLRITDKTISEIAYNIGYTNTSKFAKTFRMFYGLTPSNYRKKCGFGVE